MYGVDTNIHEQGQIGTWIAIILEPWTEFSLTHAWPRHGLCNVNLEIVEEGQLKNKFNDLPSSLPVSPPSDYFHRNKPSLINLVDPYYSMPYVCTGYR